MIRADLRDEALLILDGRGTILDTAGEVTRLMRQADVESAIIDGVAVVLHGHTRTTVDVDLFVSGPTEPASEALVSGGFVFDADRKEFVRDATPVHLVTLEQLQVAPRELIEIEGIQTVSLRDLIDMKLRSGSSDILRAQDLADVIGLIRHHRLRSDFARDLDKALRTEFRKLVKAIDRSG